MSASNPVIEYHLMRDVFHEAGRQGDITNAMRIYGIADSFLDQAPVLDRIYAKASYIEGVATVALRETIEAQTNQGE